VVRARAGLHGDGAGRQGREELQHLAAPQLLAEDNRSRRIGAVGLKHVLRKVQSNGANLSHGRLLQWLATPPLWHTDAVGGVHPINLPAHKSAGVRAAIEATGARLRLLPPYSPDFNPIELAFAKLKALLRRAAARTIPELWDAIAAILPTFSPAECANYFTACGYEPD
jgi:DDE superfamily endonuclease